MTCMISRNVNLLYISIIKGSIQLELRKISVNYYCSRRCSDSLFPNYGDIFYVIE